MPKLLVLKSKLPCVLKESLVAIVGRLFLECTTPEFVNKGLRLESKSLYFKCKTLGLESKSLYFKCKTLGFK